MSRFRPARALCLALILVSGQAAHAHAQQSWQNPDCDPEVEQALVAGAERGIRNDLVTIRDPQQGIRNPDSIFDLSCVENLLDFRSVNIHVDPTSLLSLLKRKACGVARDAYRRYVGRTLDATVLVQDAPRLPGISYRPVPGTIAPRGSTRDAEILRGLLGGETPPQ